MKAPWLKYLGTQAFAAHLGDAIAQGFVEWSEMHQVWTATEKGKPWLRS